MTIRIEWTNGKIDEAGTYEALEDLVRADQFREYGPVEFREEMAKRAYRWSLAKIDTTGTSEDFIRELAYARLVRIDDDSKGEK